MSLPSLSLSPRHIASSGKVRTSFEIHSYYILNRSSMVSPNSAIPHTPFRLSEKMRPGPCYTCSHEETHPPQPGGILAKFPNSESCRLYRSYITQNADKKESTFYPDDTPLRLLKSTVLCLLLCRLYWELFLITAELLISISAAAWSCYIFCW